MMVQNFSLGDVVITPGAVDSLRESGETIDGYVRLHQSLDAGCLPVEDQELNKDAAAVGGRIHSAFTLKGGKRIWIITEADRSVTTVLTPGEY